MSKTGARIVCVAGARPNFMKVAPILRQIARSSSLEGLFVHTGQHFDPAMSESFLRDLGMPEPFSHLGVGADTPARQTARILERFEPILEDLRPSCVVVVGDVNSTLAAALAAVKAGFPLAHVEAGLRSRDRTMPEEINRILTDACSDHLFTPSPDADANLIAEGTPASRIHRVGNVMIDSLRRFMDAAGESVVLDRIGIEPGRYALVTLHRPSNVDDRTDLARTVAILEGTADRLPVVFPVHPRTRLRLEAEGWTDILAGRSGIRLLEPQGYIDFLRLLSSAAVVLTDSGGIQEETTVLGVACLTLRPNTERPITVTEGTNRVVGSDPPRVFAALDEALAAPNAQKRVPDLWDGRSAERIVRVLEETYGA